MRAGNKRLGVLGFYCAVGLTLGLTMGCGDDASGGNNNQGNNNHVPPIPTQVPCPDVGLDPSAGAVHYVCDCLGGAAAGCVPGDDAADGTSPETPWQTYEQARSAFGNLAAGDSVAFCRGGAFEPGDSTRWYNYNCRADQRCVIRDYVPSWGTEQSPPPLIRAGVAFSFEDGGDADHDEGYIVMNLALTAETSGEGQGVFFYNDVDDVLLCNLDIDDFGLGVHLAGSNAPEAGSDGRNSGIVVRNSRITNCSGQGFLGGGDDSGVEYTYFENNGFGEAVFNHNIYFSHPTDGPTLGMFAVGNELYRSAVIGGECQGVSLVVHGQHDGLLIAGNTVREDIGGAGQGCWGIAMDTGYGSAELFRNVTIAGNTIINVGNTSLGINACEDCLIENNVILHEQAFGTIGIAAPNRDRAGDDLPMTRVVIRNNSIYLGAAGGLGIRLGEEGTQHVVVSNAVYYSGTEDSFDCFDLPLAPDAYRVVDHNLCYHPQAAGAEWVRGQGDLVTWQSGSGHDAASLVADPQFTAVSDPHDLAPAAATSPLVNAGHPDESAAVDRDDNPRDSQPDIGAYELQ